MAVANLHEHPSSFPPMPAVARVLAGFDRQKLEGFITVAIGLLDVLDGDADEESNNAEDEELHSHFGHDGPGCLISDGPEEDDHSDDPLDHGEGTWGIDC